MKYGNISWVTPRAAVELFHLAFLAELGRRIDQRLYAVKGGCNLRFFFKSPRYSEDLDLDVHTVALATLRKRVTNLLASKPFEVVLASKSLRLARHSAPKQTETTQRWKVALESSAAPASLHTRVEFSRRKADGGTEFDAVDPVLIAEHGIPPILATHYTAGAAFAQKVRALAHRPATQARDIFDLDLLLRSGHSRLEPGRIAKQDSETARVNIESVDFDTFAGQVLAFLPQAEQRAFGNVNAWQDLMGRVRRALERYPS